MIQRGGFWWPDSDTKAHPVIMRDCGPDIAALLPHIRGRDCIVQAGGNVGLYPVALADHFRHVVTFEPDPDNWTCLTANLSARDGLRRVTPYHAALGDEPGVCRMFEVQKGNCGAHRIIPGRGSIPILTIDSLNLDACDAIWLDCEGYELPALKGASDTIERFSPAIAIEDKGLEVAFGAPRGEAIQWLGFFGYEQVDRVGRDKIFTRNA